MAHLVSNAPQRRRIRRPRHDFYLITRPWQLQPFMLAPVLPGETLRNLMFQARAVTDPVANPLIGWWNEYWFFYVQFDDFEASVAEDLKAMMLDVAAGPGIAQTSAHNRDFYTALGGQKFTYEALRVITEHYFRDEGETAFGYTIGNLPIIKIGREGVHQSLMAASEMPTYDVETGTDVAPTEDVDALMRNWEVMTMMGLTKMSWEDYLKSAGVRGREAEDPAKPELIRYVREWQYPSNTINPSTGAPSSAVSWSTRERADKDRFFTQPGFLIGITCCRPKVYLGNQEGSAASFLDNMKMWLPPLLRGDDYTSLREFAEDAGFYDATDEGYWVDMRDLFAHGDQFLNFDPASVTNGGISVNLPLTTDVTKNDYASATDADNMFTEASNKRIRQDGVVELQIASFDGTDRTP